MDQNGPKWTAVDTRRLRIMLSVSQSIFQILSLIEKYHVSLKKFLKQCTSNPEFYGDLVYKFKKIIGNPNVSGLFKGVVNRSKRAGYTLDIMRQTAYQVFNPFIVEGHGALFSCTTVVQASDSMTVSM